MPFYFFSHALGGGGGGALEGNGDVEHETQFDINLMKL